MPRHAAPRVCDILLVEDSAAEARLTREVLRESQTPNSLHHVKDGIAAMRFLRREYPYHDAPTPDLIILDLNLPCMDGRDVLCEVRQDPNLRLIPVVVLTTSEAEGDILQSYELSANCFITKPSDLDRFIHVVQTIVRLWLTIATLPNCRHRRVSDALAT